MNQKGGKENCPVHQVGWARGGGGGLRRRSSAHLFILVDVCSSSEKIRSFSIVIKMST